MNAVYTAGKRKNSWVLGAFLWALKKEIVQLHLARFLMDQDIVVKLYGIICNIKLIYTPRKFHTHFVGVYFLPTELFK